MRCFACLLVLAVGSEQARAQPGSTLSPGAHAAARRRYDAGIAKFRNRDFAGASVDLQAAYALEPSADSLFAWAQAERLRGNCAAAASLYRKVLAEHPPEGEAQAVIIRRLIAQCEPPGPPPAAPTAASAPPPRPPAQPPAPFASAQAQASVVPAPWYKDWVGGALCATGFVLVVTGGLLLHEGYGAVDSARENYDRFADAKDAAWQRIVGSMLAVAGGALVVGGVVRYELYARRGRSLGLQAWPERAGGSLLLGGHF